MIKGKYSESDYPTSVKLELKKGARVMTLINRRKSSGELDFVNGDVGEIVKFHNVAGNSFIEIKLDNGNIVKITPNEWKNYEYILTTDPKTGKVKVEQKEVGSFIQYPLQLGYALAIHKAQGKTLDRVIIDIDRGAFAHGQLYVALSRTRKKTDMYIKRTITEDDIIFSKRIKSFLE
jgi:ATP-dependent exoDNAse (exonuclease V) alpha subunit